MSSEKKETKKNLVVNYLKSLATVEAAIEPYKEQKKDLRKEYIDNGWLNRDEIWAAVRAFRFYQKGANMDSLNEMYEVIEEQFGAKDEF